MSRHPAIFETFGRRQVTSDGRSVYDFLGGSIDAEFKQGWSRNVQPRGKSFRPPYPGPSEWTIDWVASLLAARLAGERFGVIELGAGYGHWMVAALMAFKQLNPERPASGLALEAEPTHYHWLERHVATNLGHFDNVDTTLLAMAAGYDGEVEFPVVQDPAGNYGATYGSTRETDFRTVPCLSLASIYDRMGAVPPDLLHCDIQGAEVDLLAQPGAGDALAKTRVALFGTHRDVEVHLQVVDAVRAAGLHVAVEWPRNVTLETAHGEIRTHDGAVLAIAHTDYPRAVEWIDFQGLRGEVVNRH